MLTEVSIAVKHITLAFLCAFVCTRAKLAIKWVFSVVSMPGRKKKKKTIFLVIQVDTKSRFCYEINTLIFVNILSKFIAQKMYIKYK